MKKTKTKVIVSNGQYEQSVSHHTITHTTERGLMRRCRQLSKQYEDLGDNWAGWIKARVAIAHNDDVYGDNQIIGGQWCDPVNGWLDLW